MTDKAALRNETKKHVRALLISSPVPLTVNELKRDFHDFIGKPIPSRQMGYATLEDFFRDIPDVVQIGWKNGVMTLRVLPSESNKHIEKLVSKQKVSKPKKYAYNRIGSGRLPGRSGRPPTYSSDAYYSNYTQNIPPRLRSNRPPRPTPIVPAYIRTRIKEMFKTYPDGVPLTHFDTAFSRRFGSHLDFQKYDFITMRELLGSIRDTVIIQELQGGECRVLPAMKSSVPVHTENRAIRRGSPVRVEVDMEDQEIAETTEHKSPLISPGSPETRFDKKRPSKGRGKRRENSGDSGKSLGQGSAEHAGNSGGSLEELSQFDDDTCISEQLQEELRQVLENKPDGIWAKRLPIEFREFHGKQLNFQEQGHLSVIDFVSSLTKIVRIERPDPKGDWLLFDARIPPPREPESDNESVGRDRHSSGQNLDRLKDLILQVLDHNPSGINIKDFERMFEEFTGHKLPVGELGFDSASSFLLSLTDSLLQMNLVGGNIFLYSIDADVEEDTAPTSIPSSVPTNDIPDDIVGPGCYYGALPVPEPPLGNPVEGFIEVYVSNISSPGLFWLQLRGKDTTLAMENLMDHLDYFYNCEEGENYKMPDSLLVVGQVCATLYPEDQNWHRGVISGVRADGLIQVYYVDYGNTCCIQKNAIRLLKMEYLRLPAQALQARLSHVQPLNQTWSIASKNHMLQLCANKPLIALVTATRDRVVSVLLTDTSGRDDVHINDVMVQAGYAEMVHDNDNTDFTGASHPEVPDYDFVYGTFSNRQAPRLPHKATEPPAPEQSPKHLVKCVQLTREYSVHVINLEKVAYLLSAEVSAFFWEADVLNSMLRQKRLEARKLTVSADSYPRLFKELQHLKVRCVFEEGDEPRQFLTLYQLDSVPRILDAFHHQSAELCAAIQLMVDNFYPDGPDWLPVEPIQQESIVPAAAEKDVTSKRREVHKAEEVQGAVRASEEKPTAEQIPDDELQFTLKALQFKRKRILQQLMSDPSSMEQSVNELNDVEVNIVKLKKALEDSAHDRSSSPSVERSPTKEETKPSAHVKPQMTPSKQGSRNYEDQKALDDILAASTKPIAAAQIMTKANTSSCSSQSNTGVPSTQSNPFLFQAGSQPLLSTQNQSSQNLPTAPNPFLFQTGLQAGDSSQNQLLMNQMIMNQVLLTQSGMMPGMNPQYPGLLPGINPMMFPYMQNPRALTGAQVPANPGTVPGVGRGQPLPDSMGILPGLYPLLQNWSLGRGGRGGNGSS